MQVNLNKNIFQRVYENLSRCYFNDNINIVIGIFARSYNDSRQSAANGRRIKNDESDRVRGSNAGCAAKLLKYKDDGYKWFKCLK